MPDNTVLPLIETLTEEDFHAEMMVDISRLIAKHGRGRVAERLGTSTRQLGNLANGSFPAAWRLFNLLTLDRDALDSIERRYNSRRVPRKATCSTDPIGAKLAALLTRVIDIERVGSDGGEQVTLGELLTLDEAILRETATTLCGWIERIDAYRHGEQPNVENFEDHQNSFRRGRAATTGG